MQDFNSKLPAHTPALPCDAVNSMAVAGPMDVHGGASAGAPASPSGEPSGTSASTPQPITPASSAAASGEFGSAASPGGGQPSPPRSPHPPLSPQQVDLILSSPATSVNTGDGLSTPTDSTSAQSRTLSDGEVASNIDATGPADPDLDHDSAGGAQQTGPAGTASDAGGAGGRSTAGAAAALLIGAVTAAITPAAHAASSAGSASASASESVAGVLAAAAATAAAATMYGYVMAPEDGPGGRETSSSADSSPQPSDCEEAEDESASKRCPSPMHHPHVPTAASSLQAAFIPMSGSSRSVQRTHCFGHTAGGGMPDVHTYHTASSQCYEALHLTAPRHCLSCGSTVSWTIAAELR